VKAEHKIRIHRRCPVDGALDAYDVTVTAARLVRVEDILGAISELPEATFQEDLTQRLAAALRCRVRTVGHHSGVRTTCTA
jgi:hypothetical protein